MVAIDKFSACIVVDGKELDEYGAETLGERTVSFFVPRVVDQVSTMFANMTLMFTMIKSV